LPHLPQKILQINYLYIVFRGEVREWLRLDLCEKALDDVGAIFGVQYFVNQKFLLPLQALKLKGGLI
jgi:hypothetical protein